MLYLFNMAGGKSCRHSRILYDSDTGYDYAFVITLKRIKPLEGEMEYGIYQTK